MAGAGAIEKGPVSPRALLEGGTAAGVWELDLGTSELAFSVKHFWGAVTVRGRFHTFAGLLVVDPSGTATGSIDVDAASLDTENALRDQGLRSANFFDVANHPSVGYSIGQVQVLTDDSVRVTGDLSAAGRTLPVTFDARLTGATAERVTLDGQITVDRTRLGMMWRPLQMASSAAQLVIHARFIKSAANELQP